MWLCTGKIIVYASAVGVSDGVVVIGPTVTVERVVAFSTLAAPGMPPGSPGMEAAGGEVAAYDVISFDKVGSSEIYASDGQ